MALTSNLSNGALSNEAKQLIAQIKLKIRDRIKQEITSEINLEKHNNNQKGLNQGCQVATFCLTYSQTM